MASTYHVINASAGSGKTYALVSRLLAICLKYPNQEERIQNILALTFTNKAANEMKKRLLDWLAGFAKPDYARNGDLANIKTYLEEEEGIKVSLEDLHLRAAKMLDYVLHHYSTLNISTIDKFNSKLVRNFSYELGLAKNFNLEIQPEPYLMEAVDQLLDGIGDDTTLSETFLDFVTYNLDNHKRISLSDTLYKTAKEFVQDKHYFHLQENKDFSWTAYEELKNRLRTEIQQIKEENIRRLSQARNLITRNGLEISDFSGGKNSGLGKFFEDALKFYNKERKDFPLADNEDQNMERYLKGTSATGKAKEATLTDILPALLEMRRNIIADYVQSEKKKLNLRGLLPLKINKEIQDQLAQIEEENDLVLLSKFNILIHENLRKEPSAFIYEKVGTRYSHYFFDEFQDTSQLQWQNFLPLRDHTITSENSSFTLVGDPKQSIYSFRGGDSQLMLDIINNKEQTPVQSHLKVLENNWRSATNIVDFNNRLYLKMSASLKEEYQDIFGKDAQQTPKASFAGRVRINLLENNTKEAFFSEVAEKMQQDLQSCADQGFKLSDITILCRGNDELLRYAQKLGNLKINYQGEEIYIKTISEKGLTLDLSSTLLAVISFLEWHQNPKNKPALVGFMYHLNESGRISLPDFTENILEVVNQGSKEKTEAFIEEKYQLKLNAKDRRQLNLYNFIEYYTHLFSVENKEVDFRLNFLELVYNYSQNSGLTLKDFLQYWQEEGKNQSVQASENIDAVQLMTIHKSKGLEFPVVFLPMRNAGTKEERLKGWWKIQEENLHSVETGVPQKKIRNYDPEMMHFYEELSNAEQLDRFCIQYVATTRAVEQMYFYIEKPNKTQNYLEIYDFVTALPKPETDAENTDSFDVYETNPGILQKQKKEDTAKTDVTALKPISTAVQNSSVRIATPSRNYQERNEKVRFGIFAHEVLSKIQTSGEIDEVLRSYVLEGSITHDEAEEIKKYLREILEKPEFAAYFAEGVSALNERDLMISGGGKPQHYRPDRIVVTDEGCIILDFKTGKPEEKHKKQLENYKAALESLGKTVLKTELIYL